MKATIRMTNNDTFEFHNIDDESIKYISDCFIRNYIFEINHSKGEKTIFNSNQISTIKFEEKQE
ncbi:hypothetical protein [Streptococcus parauberis]|uniref:hypothetical protein n=1 Tax=Streptococcus parauberis TaxID=1348 RepID=UPI00031569B4|nr:hypothetical protein [Streptococcus parauberis]QBX27370.1 hypothetical protein Javan384_0035 [Streptococcus phage Javan384]UWM90530.1 hypothetical protein N2A94_08495 [Streptococcus parauberis]UWM91267.1 hypothetical protein N2A94_01180 [Streptococcus parauberis]